MTVLSKCQIFAAMRREAQVMTAAEMRAEEAGDMLNSDGALAYDAAAARLLGLIAEAEERGLMAEIADFLDATYVG